MVRDKRRTVILSLAVVVFMSCFSYALVPLYNVMCKQLGINGKVQQFSQVAQVAQVQSEQIDKTRTITLQFITQDRADFQDKFFPMLPRMTLHPGEEKRLSFYVENPFNETKVLQAIPSISPGLAAKFIQKLECFCFVKQTLEPKEGRNMPMIFKISNDLPASIHTITLSYTLYDVTPKNKNRAAPSP